jgi:hypothetical protein
MSAKRTQFAPDDLAGATLMPNSSTATVENYVLVAEKGLDLGRQRLLAHLQLYSGRATPTT